jgi:hypothetical protein
MPFYQGFYKPKNPSKYKGNPTNIVYRSRWEFLVMDRLDKDPNVIWWGSEEIFIPYRSPLDNKIHRYFPDFIYCYKDEKGNKITVVSEVKPKYQTQPPTLKENAKNSNKYKRQLITYSINQAKWEAAENYCKKNNYKFTILTEKELGIKY